MAGGKGSKKSQAPAPPSLDERILQTQQSSITNAIQGAILLGANLVRIQEMCEAAIDDAYTTIGVEPTLPEKQVKPFNRVPGHSGSQQSKTPTREPGPRILIATPSKDKDKDKEAPAQTRRVTRRAGGGNAKETGRASPRRHSRGARQGSTLTTPPNPRYRELSAEDDEDDDGDDEEDEYGDH